MRQILFKLSVTLMAIVMICARCKDSADCHRHVYFFNNSGEDVYSINLLGTELTSMDAQPNSDATYLRKAGVTRSIITHPYDCLEKTWFEDGGKTQTLYVWKTDLIKNSDWDSIVRNNIYTKRYVLTLEDMRNNNWTVTYP